MGVFVITNNLFILNLFFEYIPRNFHTIISRMRSYSRTFLSLELVRFTCKEPLTTNL